MADVTTGQASRSGRNDGQGRSPGSSPPAGLTPAQVIAQLRAELSKPENAGALGVVSPLLDQIEAGVAAAGGGGAQSWQEVLALIDQLEDVLEGLLYRP